MKKIFILGASMLQVPAIKKAKEKGLYVYVLDYDPEAAGIKFADKFLCISTIDKKAVLEAAKEYKPDYIITSTSDMPVRTVAFVNEQLGRAECNDISFEDSVCATDKAAMRRRMEKCGVSIPEYHVIGSAEELKQVAEHMEDRFIIKPADNAASRGVILIDRNDKPDYDRIYAFTHEYSRSGEVLVEEFMTGPEVSVESFTVDGETHIITITDKKVTKVPFFVETGHTQPSRLPAEMQADIRRVTIAAAAAIRIKNGPSHTEIKCTPQGAKLVEIAARLGGDFITSRLVPLSTGVDLIDCSICSVTGQKVNWERTFSKGSAIRFIQAKPGTIRAIEGMQEAESMPGICEVALYKQIGDYAEKLESSGDRIGHVIAQGDDADDAQRKCEAALDKIRIITGGCVSGFKAADYKAEYEIGSEFNYVDKQNKESITAMFDCFRLIDTESKSTDNSIDKSTDNSTDKSTDNSEGNSAENSTDNSEGNSADNSTDNRVDNRADADMGNVVFMRCGRDAIGLIADDIIRKRAGISVSETGIFSNRPKVFMPSISCDSMYLPFTVRNFELCFYGINEDFSIDMDSLEKELAGVKSPVILTMNLFGASDRIIANALIKKRHPDAIIIEDVTHILFNTEKYDIVSADYEIGSIRKWLGVADGAIAICNNTCFDSKPLYDDNNEFACKRNTALRTKTDYLISGEKELKASYRRIFAEAEASLENGLKPYAISKSSYQYLYNMDRSRLMLARRLNYEILRKALSSMQQCGSLFYLMPEAEDDAIPFMLPILLDTAAINEKRKSGGKNEITRDIFEKKLASRNLYAPVLWPADPKAAAICNFAGRFSENMLAFWTDQRYETEDMKNTAKLFMNVLDDVCNK